MCMYGHLLYVQFCMCGVLTVIAFILSDRGAHFAFNEYIFSITSVEENIFLMGVFKYSIRL